ncbi:heavy metal translocating P-type ATPase [Gudongella oleilytica]|jgi:heavy metal translocating P-type ATPase|uniref:heavy metal translocating P-type ATPase n=1 Tax=Gudongella oleilytica TaxID=1582259 RepID=UPI000FF894FC|nr:cation-translocating P-type ATPase [Gudongella oleilytica]
MKKLNHILSGVPLTIISGIFLVVSLVFMLNKIDILFDPAWFSVLISGIPLLSLAIWRVIYNEGMSKISSALLISIAMIAAIAIGDVFAAGEVAFIMALGGILEDKTAERSKKGIKKLIGLTPQQGRVLNEGNEKMVNVEEIRVGDRLRVLPGEAIPVDGKIVVGATSVDQAIMTGESLPVDKEVGDNVYCGTINQFGAIDIEATNVGEDSSLQKLIRMVKDAENKQAKIQRVADRWAIWLVPAALLLAIITYLVTEDIVRGVTILVVFCPCALVLATPTAIMAAIGQATKHGIIIKSGEALEKMGKVDTIAFDKTGTLTHGSLEISDIIPLSDDISDDELLILVASAELRSEHPVGRAIVKHAKEKKLKLKDSLGFQMSAGKGIFAKVENKDLHCGNVSYLKENSIEISNKISNILDNLQKQGKASILAAVDGICVGVIGLSDVLRNTANRMVADLNSMGTQTILLTGDNHWTANYFAEQVGITSVQAGLLPEDKVNNIIKLLKDGKSVCMIGDGVNDAPALKAASVGVAMGAMGSDIAVEAADIALMSDDISKIPYLKRLSNATVRTIKFSIFLSLVINFLAIIMSFFGWLTPTTGALVHNAGSIFVVMIAAMLYDRKFD